MNSYSDELRGLIQARLAAGPYECEEDLIRAALQALEPWPDDVAAIQAGIDELNAGDEGLPLAEAIAEIRETAKSRRAT